MKLTENELNFVLSQILLESGITNTLKNGAKNLFGKDTIKEPLQKVNVSKFNNNNTDWDNNTYNGYVSANPKNSIGKNIINKTLNSTVKGTAITILAAAAGAALNSGFGDFISTLGFGAALFGVIKHCADAHIRQERVLQMKLPKFEKNALDYGRYAAAERAYLQQECKKLQTNLNNAMTAYNEIFTGNTINWQTIKTKADGGIAILNNVGNDGNSHINVNYGTDFSNKYVKESIIKEDITNNEQENTVQNYIDAFNKIIKDYTPDDAQIKCLSIVIYIAKAYNAVYGLWWKWGHYIGKLCAKFPKTLTWEKIIDSNRPYSTGEIISHYAKMLLPKEWAQYIPDGRKEEKENEFDNKLLKTFTFKVSDPEFKISKNFDPQYAQKYTIFQCTENNLFYATKYIKNINTDQTYKVTFSKNNIKGTIKDKNNNSVYVLTNDITPQQMQKES